MTRLAGAVVLVTGASSGIGAATARLLARSGAVVLAAGRSAERLADLPTGVRPLRADLCAEGGPAGLAAAALGAAGRVDVVVHAAGVGGARPLVDCTDEQLRELVQVDLLAVIELTARLLPGMLQRADGHVVAVSSVARLGVTGEAAYSATKAGLAGFCDALRLEVAGTGVRITEIVPGAVSTPMLDRRHPPYDRRFPRPVSADRVAAATAAAIEHDRDVVHVPGWLALASRLHGVAPGLYARLATRFG